MVQEKIGRYQGTGVWKIPTGVADEVHIHQKEFIYNTILLFISTINDLFNSQSEDIFAAAVREVKEETGVSEETNWVFFFILNFFWNFLHTCFTDSSEIMVVYSFRLTRSLWKF